MPWVPRVLLVLWGKVLGRQVKEAQVLVLFSSCFPWEIISSYCFYCFFFLNGETKISANLSLTCIHEYMREKWRESVSGDANQMVLIAIPLEIWRAFQVILVVKNKQTNKKPTCLLMQDTQETCMPGSGRSSGGGNSNPLQYFFLENPMDRETWWATSIGLQRVGHDWSDLACTHSEICNFVFQGHELRGGDREWVLTRHKQAISLGL